MTAWPPFQLEKFALVIVKGERPGEEHPISPSVLALLAERKVATENDATKLLLQAHFVSKQFGFVSAKVCFRLISPPASRGHLTLLVALRRCDPGGVTGVSSAPRQPPRYPDQSRYRSAPCDCLGRVAISEAVYRISQSGDAARRYKTCRQVVTNITDKTP